MRVRECQYCKCLVEEASWCDCAEAERDMRAFDHMVRASRSAPKPATTEPPLWAPQVQALLDDLAKMERKARQEVSGITDLMRGVSPPADRALEDFTARRKAKREDGLAEFDNSGPHWACEHCGLLVKANDAAYSAHESACDARIIARAMSTPLPHDPPLSVRLMPYRSKEP